MASQADLQRVYALLDGLDDEAVRELSLLALREWRRKHPDAKAFSMHSDYGREMLQQLTKRDGSHGIRFDADEANSLKEAFHGAAGLADPAMTGVLEFIWWFVRAGYGVVFGEHGGYPLTIRVTRAGATLLNDQADWLASDGSEGDVVSRARRALFPMGWIVPPAPQRLGGGGGGAVYKCYARAVVEALENYGEIGLRTGRFLTEMRLIDQLVRATPEGTYAALKIAHRVDPRLEREVDAMKKVEDPHLVRVLARDDADHPQWFLMEFFDGGMLHGQMAPYYGRAKSTLSAVLPLARALGRLHAAGLVHRDVKTKNIFRRANGDLVLGDLGIVFDPASERVTTYESPRSKDWTPPWKASELTTPARDVFALARVIYSMLTGDKVVEPHWLTEPEHALASLFPDQAGTMAPVDDLLQRHIVQRKSDCASEDGSAMAAAIERTIASLEPGGGSETIFRWGAGHADPKSGPNRSLVDTPVLIPAWARRLTARGRYFHSAVGRIEFQIELRPPHGSDHVIKSLPVGLGPGRWSDEASLSLEPSQTGWRNLAVTGEYSGLLADFVLVALSR
jgi:hypothetical protein